MDINKNLTEQEYKDLSSSIGKIPAEYAERQKYIVCEFYIKNDTEEKIILNKK